MLKNIVPRLYQETILNTCATKNTLVVIPTGMGKTTIALMLVSQRLKGFPNSKILFLAPTKPLVEQHKSFFEEHLEGKNLVVFTGEVAPEKRAELWKNADIIFSTPQGLENDLVSDKLDLKNVSLAVFDEAHRATGEYSYVFIAKQYEKKAKYPRILALTASPGSKSEEIETICKNLFIEAIEIRTENDPDVKPYIQEIDIDWINIELPESMKKIKIFLDNCFKSKIKELNFKGNRLLSKKDLLMAQFQLQKQLSKGVDYEAMKSISLVAEAIKVQHTLELLETQSINSLNSYFEKIYSEASTTKTKAVKNLSQDANFKSAYILAKELYENNIEHPKIEELKKIVRKEINGNLKAIIFTQFRDSASKILEEMSSIGIKSKLFVGQAKKKETGLSQKEQKKIIEEFKNHEFNVLIATSVAEEGLDIPKVDLVVFYEPIPSAIRHIQRRGRTGRLVKGKVIILVTKNTRDEAYRWSSFNKEKKMYSNLREMKNKPFFEKEKSQKTDNLISENEVRVFVDYREKASGVVKELLELGININLQKLEIGDYVASSRCGIEIKKVPDFVDSIIDGRLLQQLKDLKNNFERPLLILEGEESIYSARNMHPNAIRGMLSTIAVSYGIPLLQTRNFKETAQLIAIIAKREQEETTNYFNPHGEKKPLTLKEQQEYIISAFPNIGTTLAKPLLQKFRTIRGFCNASEQELKEVDLIGPKKAKTIKEILETEYKI